jgi:hypothetical protein
MTGTLYNYISNENKVYKKLANPVNGVIFELLVKVKI